ncbi:UNVERIFIED_CONTAM: hypothetical protein Sangu_2694600 [Sesamum angustifolium]|uniref:ARM repeat superfamily protein n=1 Tax=Sesamum angustifolium TaxID=2727405 RepID=A0AAW2IYM8_9LAMI
MEKSPAACAMDWSIQLEKSLRSQKPGKAIEALEEIGRRLEWWNSESELRFAEYCMFGLIPGEDKLFLNAIFLRLADAFRLGNKQIKNGVVSFLENEKEKEKENGEGDAEERALALLLFGCWAYFSKDCADIRYIILSSLVSGDVLEVKAAFFAAGCLSELSDDFANVFLEILTVIVSSPEISRDLKVKLEGEHSPNYGAHFRLQKRHIRCKTSYGFFRRWLLSSDANFTFKELLLGGCFYFLLRSESQPPVQLEALRILHKILLFNLSIIHCAEIPDLFLKLLVVVKSMLQSNIVSTRVLAVRVLADLSGKVLGREDIVSV